METRDHEKGRAELRRPQGVAPGTDPLVHDQLGPLEGLHPDECGAQCRGDQQQDKGFDAIFSMAMAVNFGYRKDRVKTFVLLLITAALGATFVGMQAFEWTKLIMDEGIRPWGNPLGAAQFGSTFFMITGFHGTHVSIGVIFLIIVAIKVIRGDLDHERPGFMTGRKGKYEIVEIMGLYWHFVDLVWVFIFAVFYLW